MKQDGRTKRKKTEDEKLIDRDEIQLKEIPEVSKLIRKANYIPVEVKVDKDAFREEYKEFLGAKLNFDSDEEYEEENLEMLR